MWFKRGGVAISDHLIKGDRRGKAMAQARRYEITLRLDNLEQFFTVPDPNPFYPRAHFATGLETISAELKPKALIRKVHTTIVLPPDQITPDGEVKLREALNRYCQHHLQQNRQDLISLRWQGVKALQNGLIFLGVCLLLSTWFENAEMLQDWLRRFAGEGFLIAGWVSLWHPIEILLYEWWPFSRQIHILESIMQMEIIFKEET
jgi:hypothetical protein